MKLLRSAVCTILIVGFVRCDEYSPFELAHKLRNLKIPDWFVPTFVCMAMEVSSLDTSKTQHYSDENGLNTTVYGIFGLPDDVFGDEPCNLSKELATDSDITDDAVCLMSLIKSDPATIIGDFSLEDCFAFWEQLSSLYPTISETTKKPEMTTMTTPPSTASRPPSTASCLDSRGTDVVIPLSIAVSSVLITLLILVFLSALSLALYFRRKPSTKKNRNFCDGSPLLSTHVYDGLWGSVVDTGFMDRDL